MSTERRAIDYIDDLIQSFIPLPTDDTNNESSDLRDIVAINLVNAYQIILSLGLECNTYSWDGLNTIKHIMESQQQRLHNQLNKELSINVHVALPEYQYDDNIDDASWLMVGEIISMLNTSQIKALNVLKFPKWILQLKLQDFIDCKADRNGFDKWNIVQIECIDLKVTNNGILLQLNVIHDTSPIWIRMNGLTDLRRIAKLNTFTAKHLNGPQCITNYRVPSYVKDKFCNRCYLKCCCKCNLIQIDDKYYCEYCVDIVINKSIYDAIIESTGNYLFINDDIIKCIMDYFCEIEVVQCCNESCLNDIRLKNIFQVERGYDNEGDKIYGYPLIQGYNTNYKVVNVYGRKLRIFCSKCFRLRLLSCSMKLCLNYDCKNRVCANH